MVLAAATGSGVVPKDAGEILTVAATLSMFAIPALSAVGRRFGQGALRRRPRSPRRPNP